MAHVEGEYVHKVYSQIAQHFSDTRFKPWPRIAQFLMEQPPGSLVADVGCGNGKYLGVNYHTYKLGSDICPELVAIAASRGHEVAVCNCLNLPYRSDQFDAAICIAVVHHLSTAVRRVAALKELVRIVRPRGKILVYVWAMEQEKRKFEAQDVMVPWHLQPKYRDQPPPLQQPQYGRARAKQNKPKKPRKRKTKEGCAGVGSDGSEPVTSRAQSDMVGESFLELSAISLYDDDDDGQQAIQCDDGGRICHGTSWLTDSAVGSEQPLTGQDREKHSEGNATSRGVSTYETTITTVVGNIDRTNAGKSGSDCAGNAAVGAASCSTVTVLHKQSSQTGTTSQPAAAVKHTPATGGTNTEADLDSQNTTLVEQGYQTFQRYYHVFKRGELSELFAGVQRVKVLEEFYDHENWCVLAQKSCESQLHTQTI